MLPQDSLTNCCKVTPNIGDPYLLVFNLSNESFLDGTYRFELKHFSKEEEHAQLTRVGEKYPGKEINTIPFEFKSTIYVFDEEQIYYYDITKH